MKRLFLLPLFAFSIARGASQSVGIGTADPDVSAILDITSTNQGLLVPRLADTTAISQPAAGLVIYNQAMRAINFHDGVQWRNLNSVANSAIKDSITISINSSAETVLRSYEQETARSLASNGLPSSAPVAGKFNFTKLHDANSDILKTRCFDAFSTLAMIQCRFYNRATGALVYEVKFETAYVYGCKDSVDPTNGFIESYSISAKKITIGAIQYTNDWPL